MGVRLVAAFLISLAVTAGIGAVLTPALRRMKAGQSIREDGPVWHNKKQGTPTMGGVMFIAGVVVACLIAGYRDIRDGNPIHMIILIFGLANAAIGFLDDYKKLKKKQNLGLKALHKSALQIIVAIVFLGLLWMTDNLKSSLYVPFFNIAVQIPAPVYFLFAVFVTIGTVNSVNITDGADGLVSGVSIPVAVCITVIAALWGLTAIGVFAAALAGGLAGFLVFNFHPAKVFMGDTGSLFLGGAICALAFAMDMPLILIPLGIVYFIEALSDIIQVFYFKITHGKRIFKMAPIHHHFEMCGWSEYKLFFVFSAVSVVFAVISYFGVNARYG